MTQFIPDGFVSIDDAAETAASHWFKDEWKDVSRLEAREIERRKLRHRIGQRRRAGELLSDQDERVPRGDDNPKLILRIKNEVRTKAWSKLRQSLSAGKLPFFLHTEIWGTLTGDDPAVWGSQKAAKPVGEITARCWIEDRGREFVTGIPLVLAAELSALLEGKTISPHRNLETANARTNGIKARSDEHASPRNPDVSVGVTKERVAAPGGVPPKYDQVAFLLEAFFLLYETGMQPKSQAELRREALLAYSSTFGAGEETPSDEWAKPIIRKLWKRLALDG